MVYLFPLEPRGWALFERPKSAPEKVAMGQASKHSRPLAESCFVLTPLRPFFCRPRYVRSARSPLNWGENETISGGMPRPDAVQSHFPQTPLCHIPTLCIQGREGADSSRARLSVKYCHFTNDSWFLGIGGTRGFMLNCVAGTWRCAGW